MIPKFVRVLLEYEMYFLTFYTEKPKDVRTLSGLLLIKHQYHKVLLWPVHVSFSFHVTLILLYAMSSLFWQSMLWKTLHFQKIFY